MFSRFQIEHTFHSIQLLLMLYGTRLMDFVISFNEAPIWYAIIGLFWSEYLECERHHVNNLTHTHTRITITSGDQLDHLTEQQPFRCPLVQKVHQAYIDLIKKRLTVLPPHFISQEKVSTPSSHHKQNPRRGVECDGVRRL